MQRDTKVTLGFLGVVMVLVAVVTIYTRFQPSEPTNQTADQATSTSPFSGAYTTPAGESVTLETAAAQYTIVVSWASWCPDCPALLETADTIARTYEPTDVAVVAVNRSEPAMTIDAYISQIVPFLADSPVQIFYDSEDHFYSSIEAFSMPEVRIFNQSKETVFTNMGRITTTALEQELNTLLGITEEL